MSTHESRRLSGALISMVLIVLLVGPILYFLSVGPMVVQLDRGEISKPNFDRLYLPIAALCRVSPAFEALCQGYVDHWRGKAGAPLGPNMIGD